MKTSSLALTALCAVLPAAAAEPETASGPARPSGRVEYVIVTASPIHKDRDAFAILVETIDRQDILINGGANLADALADVPGVSATGFATGASRPVIRGFDANRVRVLENGVGGFDVSDLSPDHGVPIDPLATRRIELIRGPATLRYGSQAIGGVVSALNDRVPSRLPDGLARGEFSLATWTGAAGIEGSLILDGAVGPFAWHADGVRRESDDYDTPLGVLSNSFFRGHSASIGGSLVGSWGHAGLAMVRTGAIYGIPGEEAFIDLDQDKLMLGARIAVDAGAFRAITLDAGHADYRHDEVAPGEGAAATFENTEWEARAEALFGAFGPFSAAALGFQTQRRELIALGEAEDFLAPTETQSNALFAFAELPLGDRIALSLGARVERTDVDGTPLSGVPTSRAFTPLSASLGIVFNASDDLGFGLTFTSAGRSPSAVELYAKGPHEASGTFEIGDPTLDEERNLSLEATLRATVGKIEFEGAGWIAWFDGFVFGRLTGNSYLEDGTFVAGPGGDFRELLYAQDDATFMGLEAKARMPLAAVWNGTLGIDAIADTVSAEFEDGNNVPRIPPFRIGGGFYFESGDVDARIRLTHVAEQDEVALFESSTDGFLALDASLVWHVYDGDAGAFDLILSGRNLTDDVQRNHVAFNKDDVIAPGRYLRVAVRAGF